jgi:hypothetical protein
MCKSGNNLKIKESTSSSNTNKDDSLKYGLAKNGGFYLPDNAVNLFFK